MKVNKQIGATIVTPRDKNKNNNRSHPPSTHVDAVNNRMRNLFIYNILYIFNKIH
jgi:hypothetical protein